MGRKISDSELWTQIVSEGRHWGLRPMLSQYGDVLVAEDIPCAIPISRNVCVVEDVRRDITAISQDYPWAFLLRNRKRADERSSAMRLEIAHENDRKQAQDRIDDAKHELEADLRAAGRGRIIIGGT